MQKKIVPTDIYQHLLNVGGDQTVDVSTVRQWVVCFSSGDSGSPQWCSFLQLRYAGSCSLLVKMVMIVLKNTFL
ncbi:hypothetical protein ABN231_18065, partial [Proteus mirabilis]|uniref:hypothetical protein n=1 Tax=Proteus mirabilis TaxID=584 RepID=UPI0032DB3013